MAEAVRNAVVTGASSGIGRAVAVELARSGWKVGIVGRDAARLDESAQLCAAAVKSQSDCATQVGAFDIRDGESFRAFLDEFGAVDLYVSNHGMLDGRRSGLVVETAEIAHEVLETNLVSSIERLHDVLKGMRARGRGQIVLVTSLAGLAPIADAPAYSASKAGLIAYGVALREALHDEGIGVSTVCPGYVATPMGDQHIGKRPFEISAQRAAKLIVKAGLANRRLVGFPSPLAPMARLSLLMPEAVNRFVAGSMRFTVNRRERG